MSNLKVGTKVRTVSTASAFYGEVGVVKSILPTEPFPYLVDFSEHGVSVPFKAKELRDSPLKIYLAGPMSGIEHYNFPAFDTAADHLRTLGHTVFNPAESDRNDGFDAVALKSDGYDAEDHGFSLRETLKKDLSWICDHAEAMALLPGWERSKGARTEVALAVALGVEQQFWFDFDENGLPA